jgi:acyl-CoA reductase-like NAD-dependent aldehyde dehydrogenase
MSHKKGEIRYEPVGVDGIIYPWNSPMTFSIGPIVAALSAGKHNFNLLDTLMVT